MQVKYRYRFYPDAPQRLALAKQFGCNRVVWNDALAACRKAGKAISGFELLRQLTQAKKTQERIWLNEASDCALRQLVRELAQAFQNFFNSCKGKRKGRKVKPPRFKKKSNQFEASSPASYVPQAIGLPNSGACELKGSNKPQPSPKQGFPYQERRSI